MTFINMGGNPIILFLPGLGWSTYMMHEISYFHIFTLLYFHIFIFSYFHMLYELGWSTYMMHEISYFDRNLTDASVKLDCKMEHGFWIFWLFNQMKTRQQVQRAKLNFEKILGSYLMVTILGRRNIWIWQALKLNEQRRGIRVDWRLDLKIII